MNDRELLEKAARAAGYTGFGYSNNFGDYSLGEPYSRTEARWNPLTNDADAFRLMVDLKLEVAVHETISGVINGNLIGGSVHHDGDPRAATRRAIVLAAASIVDTGGAS
jgi:hypothetical protein